MKKIAIIPSRYGSSRFPGKPLALIVGRPMIQHVYERVASANLFDEVYVATDDSRIFDCVMEFGGKVLMTSENHTCGTERIAECVKLLKLNDEDIVVNVQGDEPLITPDMLRDLVETFNGDDVYMGTLKTHINNDEEIDNPNVVKVITDINDDAIYFSRYAIPYKRNSNNVNYYKHVGIYGYKVWFIKKYVELEKSLLEKSESLEQLRVLENGYKIRVKKTDFQTIGVDTPEQLLQVERMILSFD